MQTKVKKTTSPHSERNDAIEICILAGGLSSRMGRDKSKLRIGRRTFLAQISQTAKTLNFPIRIIRRDLVARCGPLGGIYTAFKISRAEALLFLACDMPEISEVFLKEFLKKFENEGNSLFTWNDLDAGFPILLHRKTLPLIELLIAQKAFSLQNLARRTRAKQFRVCGPFRNEIVNINTIEDWKTLKAKRREETKRAGRIQPYEMQMKMRA